MTKKPAKTDIAAVEYLHTDLDPRDGESTDAAKERYLKRVALCEQTPAAIIDSGNGIQALWKLTTRIALNGSPEQIANIEARTKALTLRLGGTAGTQKRRPHPQAAGHHQSAQRKEAQGWAGRVPHQAHRAQRHSLSA